MAAITWQNINAPSARDVGRELDGAQRGLVGGFDKLAEILQQREAVNQGVADRGRAAGAQEYLNTLQGFKTPEELQAARMSGALDQAFAKVDVRNQADVRGAAEARIASLYGQAGAANKYAIDRAAAPGALLVAQGNTARAPEEQDLLTRAVKQRLGEEPIKSATETQINLNQQSSAVLAGKLQPTTDATALQVAQNASAQATSDAADRAANDAITLRAASRRALAVKGTVPTSDTLDTQQLIDEHGKSGPAARAAMVKALASRVGELDTNPINMLAGADKARLMGSLDANDRKAELAKQTNSLFVVGGKNAADSLSEIGKQVQAAVNNDPDKLRIVMDVVQKELTARPTAPLHIPSIVNAAQNARDWSPVASLFRGDASMNLTYEDYFKNSLYKSMKTPAYLNQLADYEVFKNDNPVTMKQQVIQEMLRASGLPPTSAIPPQLLQPKAPPTPPGKK